MLIELLHYLVAGLALFLIGANGAIVYRFWPEPWLTAKMAAVSGLLVYVALSVSLGEPAMWRVFLGLCAVCADGGAILGIWHAMSNAFRRGEVLIAYRRR